MYSAPITTASNYTGNYTSSVSDTSANPLLGSYIETNRYHILDANIMRMADEVIIEFAPNVFEIVKSRRRVAKRVIDLNQSQFLKELNSYDGLNFAYATPDLIYVFEIKGCEYKLKADIVSEKILIVNCNDTRVPLEEFISRAPKEAVRPLLFDINFFKDNEEKIRGLY